MKRFLYSLDISKNPKSNQLLSINYQLLLSVPYFLEKFIGLSPAGEWIGLGVEWQVPISSLPKFGRW
ncbi:MAG: hypothetical protein AAGJ08_13720 [Cyanobacteria bacterium P01_H01_bin.35]